MFWMILTALGLASPRPVGSVGLGSCIGAPSGITGKIYLANGLAAQFSFGGDLGEIGDVGVTADIVSHLAPLNDPSEGYSRPLYVGGGVTASSNLLQYKGTPFIGVRGVVGVLVVIDGLPIELYIETAPSLYLFGTKTNPISWGVDGQLGFRYFF